MADPTSWRSTGNPRTDAQSDFSRARRRAALEQLARRLRREPSDVSVILPFDEVVKELGRVGERKLGLQVIPLDSVVGTVDRQGEFDRHFHPTSRKLRGRWERLAEAARRGESFPPISVYRIGEAHFVEDGHHRVSVAKAQGHDKIDAYVTEILTRVGAERDIRLSDLPLKGHERLFRERVPLLPEGRSRITLDTPEAYGDLAEAVEAWGFRAIQERGEPMTREEVAAAWFRDEYAPVVEMLREAGLIDEDDETASYMRVACDRYRLLRTFSWDESVIERLSSS